MKNYLKFYEELFKILINFDREYLIDNFNAIEKNPNQVIKQFSLYKQIISKSNEILLVSYFNNEENQKILISMINPLISNIKLIFQKYIHFQNNQYITNYSP